jgi:hypothetical protein
MGPARPGAAAGHPRLAHQAGRALKGAEPEATRALSPPRVPFLAFVLAQRRRLLCRAPPAAFPVVSSCSAEQGDAARKTAQPSRTPVTNCHPYLIAGTSLLQRPEHHHRPLEQSRLPSWPLVTDSLDEDIEGAIHDCHKHLLADPVPVPPVPVVNRSLEHCRRHVKPTCCSSVGAHARTHPILYPLCRAPKASVRRHGVPEAIFIFCPCR